MFEPDGDGYVGQEKFIEERISSGVDQGGRFYRLCEPVDRLCRVYL